jgi:hypothetical protein
MERTSQELVNNITSDLADNNAGDISAGDVRENMRDIVDSILKVVSEELGPSKPFVNNIVIGDANSESVATLTLNSGVYFSDNTFQHTAYPGPGLISHNDLADLDTGDPHSIYLPSDGSRALTGSLEVQQWLNSNGTNSRGIKFTQDSEGNETMRVANNTTVKFDVDNSNMSTAKGVALAWLNFGASGVDQTVTVYSAYNINAIEREGSGEEGKFKITFKPGTLDSSNFVAVGSSNGRNANSDGADFSINTVGLAERGGTGSIIDPHYVTFYVLSADRLSDAADDTPGFVDAPVNDLVVYGLGSGVLVGTDISSITLPTPV